MPGTNLIRSNEAIAFEWRAGAGDGFLQSSVEREEGGRKDGVFFFSLLSSLLRWSLFKMSGSGSSHRWSRLYAVTKYIYMSTVLKYSFWKSALHLRFFGKLFFLKLSLHYVSKTNAALLAPLHVFFFFVWRLSSLLRRALKSAGDFWFPKKADGHTLCSSQEKNQWLRPLSADWFDVE